MAKKTVSEEVPLVPQEVPQDPEFPSTGALQGGNGVGEPMLSNTYPGEHLPQPEDLHGQALDSERWDDDHNQDDAEKTARDAQLPGGAYQTVPALTLTRSVREDGRRMAYFSGQGVGVSKSNQGREGRIGFRVSPDRREKPDGSGPDLPSKLFALASVAYKKVYGTPATKKEEILAYIQNYPIRVSGFAALDGFVITALGEVRES